jgi:hypothetical protein
MQTIQRTVFYSLKISQTQDLQPKSYPDDFFFDFYGLLSKTRTKVVS